MIDLKKIVKITLISIVAIILTIGIFLFGSGYVFYKNAVKNESLEDKISKIQQSEKFVKMDEIPIEYKNAVIAVEDHRFEEHGAIDLIAIGRALTSDIKNKDVVEGGSTITQQVIKNLYFMKEDTKNDSLDRKIAEIIMGIQLEKKYSKDEIFELYANNIYFGDGYYNIRDAAKGYFGKEPSELNLYECTLLAGIPNAPSVYSPNVNPELSKKRHAKVIRSMVKYGYLTQEQADSINLNEYYEKTTNKKSQ
ncbi:MAG: transglycosylase domain-containing protein [Clostridia bacterium]|nr:transglycosylase domain-containing protein [Clostridia bacterium]